MDRTHQEIVQACGLMHACLQGHCTAFKRVFDALPEERRNAISALGHAMWAEISAAKQEALAQAAQQDGAFQQFKGGLMAKPKRARRFRRVDA